MRRIFCLVFFIPIMIYNFFPQLKSVMFDPPGFDHSLNLILFSFLLAEIQN